MPRLRTACGPWRRALEKQRLEILRMRATGAVDVPDPDGTAADDLDAPLEEDTEE